MDKKYPRFIVGAFIVNEQGQLFLRTTPSQDNKFTCINGKVEWGNTIEQTLRENVKEKTNLGIDSFELIGLTDGLNITASDNPEPMHMVFADYKVIVGDTSMFKSNSDREYKWLTPKEWLEMDESSFGPYIYEIIQKLA